MSIVFAGRRWVIASIDHEEKVMNVNASREGSPPRFKGTLGNVHDKVVERMFAVLGEEPGTERAYLDGTAAEMLDEARRNYRMLLLDRASVTGVADGDALVVATRTGSVKTRTLFMALSAMGFDGFCHERGGLIEIDGGDGVEDDLRNALEALSEGRGAVPVGDGANLEVEKFHRHLTRDLLVRDAMSSLLDAESLPALARSVLEGPETD